VPLVNWTRSDLSYAKAATNQLTYLLKMSQSQILAQYLIEMANFSYGACRGVLPPLVGKTSIFSVVTHHSYVGL